MDFWHTLQLSPTTDIRAIKKAYATLLKQNRPDQNPEGFQQLHAAYQDALRWAEDSLDAQQAHADPADTDALAEVAPEEATVEGVNSTRYGCGDPNCEQCAADAAWEKYLDEQWELLVQRVEETLEDPQRRNDPTAWQFLVESEALLDIDFKSAFALRFLQRLLQMFSQQQESGETLLLPATITHLNQLFWWSERRHHYDDYIDPLWMDDFMLWWQGPPAPPAPAQVQPVTIVPVTPPAMEEAPAPPAIPYAPVGKRLVAMLLDWMTLAPLGLGLGLLGTPDFPVLLSVLLTLAIGYPLMSAAFELSPLQGSPGKYWCGLMVCDAEGRRIGPQRAVLRTLLYGASLYFIHIAVVINLLIWDGRLLHDRFSGTQVLRR